MDLEIILLSKVSQKEKDKYHKISLMRNLKYDTNDNFYETKANSQMENRHVVSKQGVEGRARGSLGAWDEQVQTLTYRMDTQGPTVEHRELYSVSCDTIMGKDIYICITESLCYTAKLKHTLQINYTSIK